MHLRTGMTTLLKVCGVIHNNIFGTVLHWMATEWIPLLQYEPCLSALFAWTMILPDQIVGAIYQTSKFRKSYKHTPHNDRFWGKSAVMLFVIFIQLMKLCGAIHKSDHPFTFALRRIGHLLSQQLSDCAATSCVNRLLYNTLTPTEYWLDYKFYFEFQYLIFL
jgi:hypothetical protein